MTKGKGAGNRPLPSKKFQAWHDHGEHVVRYRIDKGRLTSRPYNFGAECDCGWILRPLFNLTEAKRRADRHRVRPN